MCSCNTWLPQQIGCLHNGNLIHEKHYLCTWRRRKKNDIIITAWYFKGDVKWPGMGVWGAKQGVNWDGWEVRSFFGPRGCRFPGCFTTQPIYCFGALSENGKLRCAWNLVLKKLTKEELVIFWTPAWGRAFRKEDIHQQVLDRNLYPYVCNAWNIVGAEGNLSSSKKIWGKRIGCTTLILIDGRNAPDFRGKLWWNPKQCLKN